MKKEHSLILKAVLQNKSEKEIREIDKILDSNLDWIEIAGIALNHRLGGYIYKGLNTSQQKKMPKEEFDNTNEYLIKMNLEADCLKVQFISDASTKELKMMIERLAPVEVGLMVKTWGNGGFLEVDFKESQAIISNK